MKKFAMIFLAIFFSGFLLQSETIANVTSNKNLTLIIDRGAIDGVVSGLKGIVKAVYKEPSGEYTINIGIFTVRKVFERTAEVAIEIGKGLNPADARYVVFDQDLVASESRSEISFPAKVEENADWHLEQGDKAADAGNTKSHWSITGRLWLWHPKTSWLRKNAVKWKKGSPVPNGKANSRNI